MGCGSSKEVEDPSAPLLHGTLLVHAISATDLPDTDNTFFNIARGDLTDPYLEMRVAGHSLLKTCVKRNCLAPVWDEHFRVAVCHHVRQVDFLVRDREHVGGETVGRFAMDTDLLAAGEQVEVEAALQVGPGGETQGKVRVAVQLVAVLPGSKELEDTYFPPSTGNLVTLYQDADTPPLPVFQGVVGPGGRQYRPPRCWRDLHSAIDGAERLVYVTGWSVYTSTRLIREEGGSQGETVGELLRRKAAEGVTVLIMTWNDKSNDGGLLDGMMGTHDEETAEFFKDTGVVCINVARDKRSWLGLGGTFVSTCYTHHQKTVVVDAPIAGSPLRRLVAFVGGLDLTDGRYDTPEFPLYSSLATTHRGDFYQNCVPGATAECGPREPWHDIHARVAGPAAAQVLQNFADRWRHQQHQGDHHLVPLDGFDLEAGMEVGEEDGGPWTVQVLRSITSDSTVFSPAREVHLHRKYGTLIDNSIEVAYIKLIREAESFIYIENQYFMGSSYAWAREKDTLAHHVIPSEISQKIISKMEAGEEFRVYITIPMYPEGDPTSAASQEILYWQHLTMESMYLTLAAAIATAGSQKHPTDFLNFYCLGTRESESQVPAQLAMPEAGTPAERVRRSLRHPVYVHSKLMVVDDEYVVVGSANINQRSLGGNRDSEICLGAFQPDHGGARGGVRSFREAVWAAHLGGWREEWASPGSPRCLQAVREVTRGQWASYTGEKAQASPGHLLPYPVTVGDSGQVSALAAPWHLFPDTSASVLGAKSGFLPAKLTT